MLANPDIIKKYIGDKPITKEVKFEDGSTVKHYGKLDIDSFINKLLESPYITKQGQY